MGVICPLEKFTQYIFSENNNGKKELFESFGFCLEDSEKLKQFFELKALQSYLKGNYIIKRLTEYGPILAIEMSINNQVFYSGWIIEPEGKLRNTTPFGGWVK